MENIGLVKKVQGTEAVVEIQRTSACGESCASCKGGCTPTRKYVEARNIPEAQVGQRVKIELQTRKVLNAAMIMYVFPLASLFIGVLLGIWFGVSLNPEGNPETYGIVTGVVFLALSYFGIRIWDRKRKTGSEAEIVISRIME